MTQFRAAIRRFVKTERGATLIEYAFMAGMMIVVLAASIKPLGEYVRTILETLVTEGFQKDS